MNPKIPPSPANIGALLPPGAETESLGDQSALAEGPAPTSDTSPESSLPESLVAAGPLVLNAAEPSPADADATGRRDLPPSAVDSSSSARPVLWSDRLVTLRQALTDRSGKLRDHADDVMGWMDEMRRDPAAALSSALWRGAWAVLQGLNWVCEAPSRTVALPRRQPPVEIFSRARMHGDENTGRLMYASEHCGEIDISHTLRSPHELLSLLRLFADIPAYELDQLVTLIHHPPTDWPRGFLNDVGRYKNFFVTTPSVDTNTQERITLSAQYDCADRILRFDIEGWLADGAMIHAAFREDYRSVGGFSPIFESGRMRGHDAAIFQALCPPHTLRALLHPVTDIPGDVQMATLRAPRGFHSSLGRMLFAASRRGDPDARLLVGPQIGRVAQHGGGMLLSDGTLVVATAGLGLKILQSAETDGATISPKSWGAHSPLHLYAAMEELSAVSVRTREVTFCAARDADTGGIALFIYVWDQAVSEWQELGEARYTWTFMPIFGPAQRAPHSALTKVELALVRSELDAMLRPSKNADFTPETREILERARFIPLDKPLHAVLPDADQPNAATMSRIYAESLIDFLAHVMNDENRFFWGVNGRAIFHEAWAERLALAGFVYDDSVRAVMQAYFEAKESGTPADAAVWRTLRDRFVFAETRLVPADMSASAGNRFIDRQDDRVLSALAAQALRVVEKYPGDKEDHPFLVFFDMRPGIPWISGGTPQGGKSSKDRRGARRDSAAPYH